MPENENGLTFGHISVFFFVVKRSFSFIYWVRHLTFFIQLVNGNAYLMSDLKDN